MARLKNGSHNQALEMKEKKIKIDTYFGSNLVTALAGLNMYDFPHFVCIKYLIKLTRKHERYCYQLGSRKMQDGCGGPPVLLAIPTLAHT